MAVLGTVAVSCQKENIVDETRMAVREGAVYKVSYSVDGVSHSITLIGEDSWRGFLRRMLALAEEGHRISIRNEEAAARVASAKDVVTFVTTNQDEAISWAETMTGNGYTVYIEYDKDSGKYTCTAIK